MPKPASVRFSYRLFGLLLVMGVATLLAFGLRSNDAVNAGSPTCPATATQGSGTVLFNPSSGAPGDPFSADLSNVAAEGGPNDARAFLNASGAPGGTFVGSATIQPGGTSVSIPATVPNIAPGPYYVIICWDSHDPFSGAPVHNWAWNDVPFTINPLGDTPTPTPTPTPTLTPTPTPSPTPTPTPTPVVSPTPHPPTPTPNNGLSKFYPYALLPSISYLAPLLPSEDLSIDGIEITQGIQCFDTSTGLGGCPDNSLPMVSQKDTTARIYLHYSGPGSQKAGIPVRLHIFAAGQEYIVDASGMAHKVKSQAFADNPNIWFNVNFNSDVDVSFYAEVDPTHKYAETNEGNNRFPASGTIDIHFYKRRTYKVAGWRMNYHPSGASDSGIASGWAVAWGGPDWLNTVWPVKTGGINYKVVSGLLDWTATIPAGGSGAVVNATKALYILANLWPWTNPDIAYEDRVHVWTPKSHFVRGLSDPAFLGGFGVASVGTDDPGSSMTMDAPGFGAVNFVHEVSHNSGMHHTAIGTGCDTSGDSGTDWPYGDPKIQEFGYNVDSGHVYDPNSTYDFMSYCYGNGLPSWISPFHWNQQFSVEGASEDTAHVQAVSGGDVLAVTATLDNPDLDGDQGGTLGTLYKSDGGNLVTAPEGTGYSVQLRNGDQVLGTQQFGVSFVQLETDGVPAGPNPPLPSVDVDFTMPWVSGATSVVLLRGSQVLDTVNVSDHAPTVDVTAPSSGESWATGSTHTINWTGNDVDGDPLTYAIFYAPDGQSWSVIAAGLSTTSFDVQTDSLAGGNNAKFRVLASDGINTGYGDSAAVVVPNKAPFVQISGPQDGAVVQLGSLVVLQGGATDLEDGSLTDGSLVWSSDKDGVLGTGESLPTNTLSSGQHTITLTATDSNNATASQSITVTVGVRGSLDVQPEAIDPAGSGDVTAVVTLPPGIPTTDINTGSLHVHIGDADLTPLSTTQLGDTNNDGLPELAITLDGAAVRNALGAPASQVELDLTGSMNDGSALAASGQASLITPGDVDCSGATDAADVLAALAYTTNIGSPDCLFAGDFTCDGVVTPLDVLGILGGIGSVSISAASCGSAAGPAAVSALTAAEHGSGGFPDLIWQLPVLALPALVSVRRRK